MCTDWEWEIVTGSGGYVRCTRCAPTVRIGTSQIYDFLMKVGMRVLIFICIYSWGDLQRWRYIEL
jgi:hypothetical protein